MAMLTIMPVTWDILVKQVTWDTVKVMYSHTTLVQLAFNKGMFNKVVPLAIVAVIEEVCSTTPFNSDL